MDQAGSWAGLMRREIDEGLLEDGNASGLILMLMCNLVNTENCT